MNNIGSFKRGEIYFCNFSNVGGSVQNGMRPALIVQNNIGNKYSSTLIVAPITTIIKKPNLPTHFLLDKKYGLSEISMVMLEQLCTIDKSKHIHGYIGRIDDPLVMEKIDKTIMVSLGLKRNNVVSKDEFFEQVKLKQGNIMYICLCNKCRSQFDNGGYEVGKVIYENFIREQCDWCGIRMGIDYVIRHYEEHIIN